jgi:hypothetical protein
MGVANSLSGFFQKLELKAKHLLRAGHIPQEPPKKISDFFEHFLMVAMRFCIHKGISEKYKGKYAIRPFLLSLQGGQIILIPSPECCIFYCCFRRHPY